MLEITENEMISELDCKHSYHKDCINNWLKKQGKLGGQNKVQRLSNNRKYVEKILAFDQYSKYDECHLFIIIFVV